MFKFLKEKIKSAVSGISKKIEEEGTAGEVEVSRIPGPEKKEEAPPEEKHGKKGFFSAVTSLFRKKEEEKSGPIPEKEDLAEKPIEEEPAAEKEEISYAVPGPGDRKSTRLNSSHSQISYA